MSSKAKEAFALVSNCLMMDKDSYSILLGKQMVKGAVAHGRVPSQKIAQLSLNN